MLNKARIATLFLALTSMATFAQVRIDVTADASPDGLYPVRGSDIENLWMRPDAGIAFYSSIHVKPVRISYQPAREASEGKPATIVPPRDRLNQASIYLGNAILNAVAEHSGYRVVAEPEVGTLELEPSIAGLIAYAQQDDEGGMVPLDSVGEMRLVLELRDAFSGQLLVEASDTGSARKAFPGQDNAEAVKELFDRWAYLTAERLKKVHATASKFTQ